MAKLRTLHDLFIHELKDLYDAEHQILEALPLMIEAATHPELKQAFEEHRKQTEEQVNRLEEVFDMLGEEAKRQTCDGMKGVLKEGHKVLTEKMEDNVRDAALITAAQRVEHYEIAGYGAVVTFARLMEHEEEADLLQETLDEEGEADHILTEIAERVVNVDVPVGEEEADDSDETEEAEEEDEEDAKEDE